MDGIIILIIGAIICLRKNNTPEEVVEVLKRETRVNPDYIKDENAFMKVANNLGFF